jgi:hypothetical protein
VRVGAFEKKRKEMSAGATAVGGTIDAFPKEGQQFVAA